MMFSPEQIIKKAEELQELNETTAQALIDKFSTEQPFVLGYTIASGESFDDPAHAEGLVTLSVLIWSVYAGKYPKMALIPEELVLSCEKAHYDLLKEIESKQGDAFNQAVAQMQNNQPQPMLYDFLNQEIVQSFGDGAGTAIAISTVLIAAFESQLAAN